MRTRYDKENLDKHKLSREETDEALANEPIDEDIEPSVRGNVRVMFVGFTCDGSGYSADIEPR